MPTKNKLPKGRVMYATRYKHPHNRDTLTPIYHAKIPEMDQFPVAVIPCRTAKEARAVVSRANKYGVKSLTKTRHVNMFIYDNGELK